MISAWQKSESSGGDGINSYEAKCFFEKKLLISVMSHE
jgi:hypothetical protein